MLEKAIENQMRPTNCILILAGVYSSYSKWIQREIQIANRLGKPIIALSPPIVTKRNLLLNKRSAVHSTQYSVVSTRYSVHGSGQLREVVDTAAKNHGGFFPVVFCFIDIILYTYARACDIIVDS